MKKIVLISAKAQHGKDSAAEYLKKQLEDKGQRVVIMHFAKYIKQILKDYYNWNGEKNDYFRTKLQVLGTDIIKEKLNFKNFHAKRIAEEIQIIQDDFDFIILPDCRFKDELFYIKSMFPDETITARINRLGFESNLTEEQKLHKSEINLDDYNGFDHTIYTQNGLQHLYDETDRVLGKVLEYK